MSRFQPRAAEGDTRAARRWVEPAERMALQERRAIPREPVAVQLRDLVDRIQRGAREAAELASGVLVVPAVRAVERSPVFRR